MEAAKLPASVYQEVELGTRRPHDKEDGEKLRASVNGNFESSERL
jgi:hypothetical protein